MDKKNRGWSQAHLAKPAAEVDIRYGHGLLTRESEAWPRYFVVSTPRAFKAAEPYLGQQPAGVAYATYLDYGHLQEITEAVPAQVDLVIGIGGGTALDAAKYVTLHKDLPLILVPAIVSTGAIIHGVFAKWDGRTILENGSTWPWVDCEYVLVDYDLVLKAPAHLNTAGLGDILCNYAKIAEWRRNTKLGVGPPCDEAVASAVLRFHRGFTESFRASLDGKGNLTADSIRVIMTAVQARDERERALSTSASSGDHDFAFALELLCDRGWIHGELVALGAVIIAWHCDEDPLSLLSRLDTCLVWYRPSQLGISRDQLRRALEFVPEYMADPIRGGGNQSILRQVPLVGKTFDELWAFLEND